MPLGPQFLWSEGKVPPLRVLGSYLNRKIVWKLGQEKTKKKTKQNRFLPTLSDPQGRGLFPTPQTIKRGLPLEIFLPVTSVPFQMFQTAFESMPGEPEPRSLGKSPLIWWYVKICLPSPKCLLSFIFPNPQIVVPRILSKVLSCI